MKTNKIILFFYIILSIFLLVTSKNYTELDLKLPLFQVNNDLPIYLEADDSCKIWIPSLFNPISLINNYINSSNFIDKSVNIIIQNPSSLKHNKGELEASIYEGEIINFDNVYIAKDYDTWPKNCQFSLGYSDIFNNEKTTNFNSIKNLISTKQFDNFIFSFGTWNISKDVINSKLYVGGSHENFLEKNVGTCNNTNDSYWGCNFDEFIFMNETFELRNNIYDKYNIYFSSEFTKIYFPESFKEKFGKICTFITKPFEKIICNGKLDAEYIPMILRNDNMNITIEVDYIRRFYEVDIYENVTNILFHDENYIIFPLSMFKNFHVQFDLEKNLISFFTNDTSILEVKPKEEIEPNTTDSDHQEEPNTTDSNPQEQKIPSKGIFIFMGAVIFMLLILIFVGVSKRMEGLCFKNKKEAKLLDAENNPKNIIEL